MDVLKSMGVMIGEPWLALLPAALFLILSLAARSPAALATGALWSLYCLYEYGMKYRVLCSGECNIRIDLFVVYPALLLASLVAIASAVQSFRKIRS